MSAYFVRVAPDGEIGIIEYSGGELNDFLFHHVGCDSMEFVKSFCLADNLIAVGDYCSLPTDSCPSHVFNSVASYLYTCFDRPVFGPVVIGREFVLLGDPVVVGMTQSDALCLVSKIKRIRAAIANI